MNPKDRLLVALDVDSPSTAVALSHQLRGSVGGHKVGSRLFTLGGPQVVNAVGTSFLDLKYHDIPNTVAQSSDAAAQLGVMMFNVHCLGGFDMMKASRTALDERERNSGIKRPRVIGVTILTSHDRASLDRLKISPNATIPEIVAELSVMAKEAGLDGVVCSPQEIEVVRKACGDDFLIVTPGIRKSTDKPDDQKRTMTAAEAVKTGATYIVVGRPIIVQPDPKAAADQIVAEMAQAA